MEYLSIVLHNRFMQLDGITVFIKVVQAGSFTRAAQLLGMPNTTVSAKVAQLEKRLGVTLIQRTTRKLNITPAGQAYFERCLRAIEEIEAAESEIETTSKEPQGKLRITSSFDVAHSLLPELVQEYLKKYPKTNIELIVTNRIVDLVAEGVDIAIRAGELSDSSMIASKFVGASGGLWASPAYLKREGTPKSPREIEKHTCVIFTEIQNQMLLLGSGSDNIEVKMNGRVFADDIETTKSFVIKGLGIGLLPDFLINDEQRSGKLVRILPKWSWESESTFSLVYPAQKFVTPKVQAFIELSKEWRARKGSNL